MGFFTSCRVSAARTHQNLVAHSPLVGSFKLHALEEPQAHVYSVCGIDPSLSRTRSVSFLHCPARPRSPLPGPCGVAPPASPTPCVFSLRFRAHDGGGKVCCDCSPLLLPFDLSVYISSACLPGPLRDAYPFSRTHFKAHLCRELFSRSLLFL